MCSANDGVADRRYIEVATRPWSNYREENEGGAFRLMGPAGKYVLMCDELFEKRTMDVRNSLRLLVAAGYPTVFVLLLLRTNWAIDLR